MYTWIKRVKYDEAYDIYDWLKNKYGLEYTNGWYSTSCVCDGCRYFTFIVYAPLDDKSLNKLGFKVLGPKDETL